MNKKNPKSKIKNLDLVKSRVTRIDVNPTMVVYIDEWYLEELVDIIKEFPEEKYVELIKELALKRDQRKKPSFPQITLASHRIRGNKWEKFNEFKTMQEYIEQTWMNQEKESLLKINNLKKMKVKLSTVGGVPHVPSYLNNLSPNNMITFLKDKSIKFKKATIMLNVSGHMASSDYRKMIRQFFKTYDFESLSLGNISKTVENGIEYYRISIIKVRNGVNVNGQGLMLESTDFLRRILFMVYEIDPTDQEWKGYGNTVINKDIQELIEKEPYFDAILKQYLNPSIISVE